MCKSGHEENTGTAWLLSLDRQWLRCDVEHCGGPWYIRNAAQPGIQSGMSGSPILNHDRTAPIGVVCLSHSEKGIDDREGGPNPGLATNLPAWMAPGDREELRKSTEVSGARGSPRHHDKSD